MNLQSNEPVRHWIVRLWRVITLSLYMGAVILSVAVWLQSGDFSESVSILILLAVVILCTAYAVQSQFSINIFGRMQELSAESENRLTLYSAIGLYLVFVVTIGFVSLYILKLIEAPQIIAALTIGVQGIIFVALGYIGIVRLR